MGSAQNGHRFSRPFQRSLRDARSARAGSAMRRIAATSGESTVASKNQTIGFRPCPFAAKAMRIPSTSQTAIAISIYPGLARLRPRAHALVGYNGLLQTLHSYRWGPVSSMAFRQRTALRAHCRFLLCAASFPHPHHGLPNVLRTIDPLAFLRLLIEVRGYSAKLFCST